MLMENDILFSFYWWAIVIYSGFFLSKGVIKKNHSFGFLVLGFLGAVLATSIVGYELSGGVRDRVVHILLLRDFDLAILMAYTFVLAIIVSSIKEVNRKSKAGK